MITGNPVIRERDANSPTPVVGLGGTSPLDVVSVDASARLRAEVRPVGLDADRVAVAVVVEVEVEVEVDTTETRPWHFWIDPDEFLAAAADLEADLATGGRRCSAISPLDVVGIDSAARLRAEARPVGPDTDDIVVVVDVITNSGRPWVFWIDPPEFLSAVSGLADELTQRGLLYEVADTTGAAREVA
jgi:hypothetical protein